jgi:siderophore synthetase component
VDLVTRVVDCFLREDVGGLRTRSEFLPVGPDGEPWLRFRATDCQLLLPVRRGGFLADLTARAPVVLRRGGPDGDAVLSDLDEILDALAPREDPEAEAGFADFRAECRRAHAETALLARYREGVLRRLTAAPRTGMTGNLRYEALAAHADHPVYPTSRCRTGIPVEDLRRYAPEFAPVFRLPWVAVPRQQLVHSGQLPAWWPSCEGLDAVPLPVHPLTLGALDVRRIAEAPRLDVTPTLSMRTVAVLADPRTHLKLPLPTSTLGRRNIRTLPLGLLRDGAAVQRLTAGLLAREPALATRVLLADESTYLHSGDPLLGVLVRRYPAGLEHSRVVPLAAFAAPAPSGGLLIEELAAEFSGGDAVALLDTVLALLLRCTVTLWLRYGVVLEAHQQNVAVVLDHAGVRLLMKDNDGARIDPELAGPVELADRRMLVGHPGELADMVVTITLHLCAAAICERLAAAGLARRGDLLARVRGHVESALAEHSGARDAALARSRLLDSPRLPVKTMVTAGTLLPKERTGATDINKHYGSTAPNYLLCGSSR